MTGFGRGSAGRGKNRIDVEIRAINSRYLDTKFRGIQLDFCQERRVGAELWIYSTPFKQSVACEQI